MKRNRKDDVILIVMVCLVIFALALIANKLFIQVPTVETRDAEIICVEGPVKTIGNKTWCTIEYVEESDKQ